MADTSYAIEAEYGSVGLSERNMTAREGQPVDVVLVAVRFP